MRIKTVLRSSLLACGLILGTTAAVQAMDIASHAETRNFIDEMVDKHGFDRDALTRLFTEARHQPGIIAAITRPAEAKPWAEYRPIFLQPDRIRGGARYWAEHSDLLRQVEQKYGVPPEIVVAIIGVETRYGRHAGRYRVLDALSTLAFDYPKRSRFFRKELEQFLLLTREEGLDPLTPRGSYAGAMGHGQFIPSSYRHYAVDFDQDGRRDLWNSSSDIIGSVANYFARHGWRAGEPVAFPARVEGADYQPLVNGPLRPRHRLGDILAAGVHIETRLDPDQKATLLELEGSNGPEYWVGLHNFYVITRYNHSPLYAMAVYQLGQEIKALRQHRLSATNDQ